MKKTSLEKMIQEQVRAAVKQYVSILLPIVVNEVMDYKLEQLKTQSKPLTESVETDDDFRTLGGKTLNSTNLRELLGMPGFGKVGESGIRTDAVKPAPPIVFEKNTEHGSMPVSANDVPDFVTKALTRDYSSLVKAMEAKKRGV